MAVRASLGSGEEIFFFSDALEAEETFRDKVYGVGENSK